MFTYKKLLHILTTFIILIAAIDTYWLSKNRLIMHQTEKNPIGQYLISLDGGDVSLFIFFKFLGTYVVIASLYMLLANHPKKATVIGMILALTQLGVLFYLYQVPPILILYF